MVNLKQRIVDISEYLQRLIATSVLPSVQDSVSQRDKNKLVEICRSVKIPEISIATVVSILLMVGPQQKWPGDW
jgi:hypothetical protein